MVALTTPQPQPISVDGRSAPAQPRLPDRGRALSRTRVDAYTRWPGAALMRTGEGNGDGLLLSLVMRTRAGSASRASTHDAASVSGTARTGLVRVVGEHLDDALVAVALDQFGEGHAEYGAAGQGHV
jgi:hypothetical protein